MLLEPLTWTQAVSFARNAKLARSIVFDGRPLFIQNVLQNYYEFFMMHGVLIIFMIFFEHGTPNLILQCIKVPLIHLSWSYQGSYGLSISESEFQIFINWHLASCPSCRTPYIYRSVQNKLPTFLNNDIMICIAGWVVNLNFFLWRTITLVLFEIFSQNLARMWRSISLTGV